MDHPYADRVIVDEGDVQRDVDLRDDDRRGQEARRPALIDPDGDVQLRTLREPRGGGRRGRDGNRGGRSEEHTSELQSRLHLVCRLLLEKKKNKICRTRATEI